MGAMNKNSAKIADEIENKKLENLIIKYSLPAILSGLVAALYNIVDQIFIGNIVGLEGNAATNITFPLVTLSIAVMLLIGVGATANFSICLGKNDIDSAKKYVGTVLTLAPFIGIILSAVSIIFSKELIFMFGATNETLPLANTYLTTIALGFPLFITTEASTKLIRADGSPRYAMICSISGALLNCILNPIFMMGFNMGIHGAALATVIGQAVSFILMINYFFKFKTFKISVDIFIPKLKIIKNTVIFGVSPSVNQCTIMLTQIVLNNTLVFYGSTSSYGTEIPLACVGVITKITSIYMAVMIGIAQGAQPLLGYNYGAKKYDKVKAVYLKCIKFASVCSVIVFLCFQLFPVQIMSIFGKPDPLYLEFGTSYLRIFMFATFLNGFQPVTGNFLTAIGKPFKSAAVAFSKQVFILIPLIVTLPLFFGIDGILISGPIADVLAFVVTIIFVKIEFKKLKMP